MSDLSAMIVLWLYMLLPYWLPAALFLCFILAYWFRPVLAAAATATIVAAVLLAIFGFGNAREGPIFVSAFWVAAFVVSLAGAAAGKAYDKKG